MGEGGMSGAGAAASAAKKVGRNDPCPCGSGKKYKHCCQGKNAPAGFSSAAAEGATPSSAIRQRLRSLHLAARNSCDAGRWVEAIPLFGEIARLDPRSPQAHCDLGIAYLRSGWLPEAAASLQQAVELQPSFATALRGLVEALVPQGRESEALIACRKLSRAADDPLERKLYSARALALEGKLEEAEKELLTLLALAPERGETLLLLGQLQSNRGKFEDAARHLTQAIEVFPSAFQQLTTVKRMSEADRPLADRMRHLAERPDLDAASRVAVRFGLGKAFDDLGDYAEAIRHYDAGNQLRAASERLDRAGLAAQIDSTVALFSAEALERAARSFPRPESPGDDMPVFIAGMVRSGTTLVEQILSSHPAIVAGGELSFWHNRVRSWRISAIGHLEALMVAKAAEDYRDLLRKIGPKALRVTDKAPANLELLGLIGLAFPHARVIHCRRNPIDTCLSIYFTNFLERHDYAWNRGDLAFFYRQYERLMEHWCRVLPSDRFTEVEYEALIANPEAETRRLIAFCGLDWDDACLTPERNQRVVKTQSMWQTRQPVYKTSVERWRRYEPWLGELRQLLSEAPPAAS
jgi:tetratricopeptide (TPR) repeat protein